MPVSLSRDRGSSIDGEDLAGDVAGVVREQEAGHARDVLGFGDMPERHRAPGSPDRVIRLPRVPGHRRVDAARADAVRADPLRPALHGDEPGQRGDPALARGVARTEAVPSERSGRRNRDDAPGALAGVAAQVGNGVLDGQERAGEVHLQHVQERFEGDVLERLEVVAFEDPGARDHPVQVSEAPDGAGDGVRDRVLVTHISRARLDPLAGGGPCGGLDQARLRSVEREHRAAPRDDLVRGRPADPAGCPGDEDDLSLEGCAHRRDGSVTAGCPRERNTGDGLGNPRCTVWRARSSS